MTKETRKKINDIKYRWLKVVGFNALVIIFVLAIMAFGGITYPY